MNTSTSEPAQTQPSLDKTYSHAPLLGFVICFGLGVVFSPVDRTGLPMDLLLASAFGAGFLPGLLGYCVGKRIAKSKSKR